MAPALHLTPTCVTRGATTVVEAGSAGAMDVQALRHFIVERSETRVRVPNHLHRWRPIPGNQERCDDCEEQRWIGSVPALNGMSRRQYEAQRGFGRFRN